LIPACWAVEPPLTTFLSKVTLLWEGNDDTDADIVGKNGDNAEGVIVGVEIDMTVGAALDETVGAGTGVTDV
jgi:hypothetical protein